jgi:hypothetical protein
MSLFRPNNFSLQVAYRRAGAQDNLSGEFYHGFAANNTISRHGLCRGSGFWSQSTPLLPTRQGRLSPPDRRFHLRKAVSYNLVRRYQHDYLIFILNNYYSQRTWEFDTHSKTMGFKNGSDLFSAG